MKHLILSLALLFAALTAQSQDRWLYWKYKDYNGSVSFMVPRIAVGTGSLFLKEKSDRKMLRRVHKVRTMIFEDGTPVTSRDIRRFDRKAKRNHLEEIIMVRDGKTHVKILAKTRRSTLKKVVIFVNSPEDGFVMVSLKGKIRMADLNALIKKFGSDKNKKHDFKIPEIIKIPTDRA